MAANPKVAPMSAKAFSASISDLLDVWDYLHRPEQCEYGRLHLRTRPASDQHANRAFLLRFLPIRTSSSNHRWLDERPVRGANWTDRLRRYLGVRHAIDGHRE